MDKEESTRPWGRATPRRLRSEPGERGQDPYASARPWDVKQKATDERTDGHTGAGRNGGSHRGRAETGRGRVRGAGWRPGFGRRAREAVDTLRATEPYT